MSVPVSVVVAIIAVMSVTIIAAVVVAVVVTAVIIASEKRISDTRPSTHVLSFNARHVQIINGCG